MTTSEPSAPIAGLTSADAARKLAADGFNELPQQRPRTAFAIVRDVLAEPMFLLLLGAAAVYLMIGDLREALVLTASIGIVIAITAFQERRTEQTLAKLKDLASPRALVVRDGLEQRIPGREVVVDDIVLLHEGDRVPADGHVLKATSLAVDESILTGESLPVEKVPAPTRTSAAMHPTGSGSQIYSGTLVVSGFASVRVTATGANSEIGRIGKALSQLAPETTPLFREVRSIVRWVALGGVLLCVAIAVGYALSRDNWLEGVLAGITVAMGVLPEEFPVVLTVFLAMGAWRISRQNVLTRRMPAIETIGAATVLAVDKTGTLTENRMRVVVVETPQGRCDLRAEGTALDAAARQLLDVAAAASEEKAFDPMERAILESAGQQGTAIARTRKLVREYDLTPELLAVTHVWQGADEPAAVAVKGAPETVFDLCALSEEERHRWLAAVQRYGLDGLRVLGVACGEWNHGPLPDSPRGFDLKLMGLLCLADPVRRNVPAALAECRSAGIRVVMITGDHPGTAVAIASQAGFDAGDVLTGAEIATLSDPELAERARHVRIYARTTPAHKLRLIEAFKANGEIVVMTGDGVNDAPALKAAHVGVAMGSRGTDVAREAAALVLVNDDFASLVGAVRLGRRIYANIRHAMSYLLAVHIPIAGLGLLPVLFGWPLLLFPLHVLFLEFVVDPACSLVFEADPEDARTMQRPPRSPGMRLFSRPTVLRSVFMGSAALIYGAVVYGIALSLLSEPAARSLGFAALVIANLMLIFVARAGRAGFRATLFRPNRVFWWITALALASLTAAIYVPAAAAVFSFAPPPAMAVVAVLIAGLSVLIAVPGGRQSESTQS